LRVKGEAIYSLYFEALLTGEISNAKGAAHKRRPQSGRVCPVRTFCRQGGGGFFRCGRPHFLVQNTLDFLNLWCARMVKGRGVLASAKFCGQG